MRILVTNDDGIQSPGLVALTVAMRELGEVLVVAPDKQQSGAGSSVSFHNGMAVNEVEFPVNGVKVYAVGGTPSDCVMLGLRDLNGGARIDLLVSGINLGPNVGRDIPYSGTVMATLQGYYRRIPSMAVSLFSRNHQAERDFTVAGQFVQTLARQTVKGNQPLEAILNINVPDIPREQIKGVFATRAAATGYVNLSAHQHHHDVKYTLELDSNVEHNMEAGTDIWAIHQGYISVTPLQFNITHHGVLESLNRIITGLSVEY